MYELSFVYIFQLSDTRLLNSLEELCITRVVAVNFVRVLTTPHQEESVYIVIHRQTVQLYHNFSVWLDTQDASSLD